MADPALRPQRAALTVAVLTNFIAPFMAAALAVAVPVIGAEFHLSAAGLASLPATYLVAAAVCLVPLGRWADIAGRKRILMHGLLVHASASALLACAPSSAALYALLALQGAGGAMIFTTNQAILLSVYPPERHGRVLGLSVASVYLGLTLGPVLGGLLTELFGWRSVFLFTCALGAGAWLLIRARLEGEWREAAGEPFDVRGALAYGLSLLALAGAWSRFPRPEALVLLALGLAGLIGFVLWELRVPHPVLKVALFRENRPFAFCNLAALINYAATAATGFLLSLYLQHLKGLSPGQAGAMLLCQPALMALCSPLAGRLSDRVAPSVVASCGMGLITAGLALLGFLTAATSLAWVLAAQAPLGLGFALFASPNNKAVMSSVDRTRYGVASAVLGTMRLVGQVSSMGLASVILAHYVGGAPVSPEVYPELLAGITAAFPIFAGLCLVGTLASWSARRNLQSADERG